MRCRSHIWYLLSVLLLAFLGPGARSHCLAADPLPAVTLLTNTFNATDVGALVLHQRVGADSPVFASNTVPLPDFPNAALTIGEAGQWHFYVFTNDTPFTNAAFLIFQPAATNATPSGGSLRSDPDLDLYVSRDPAITNLDAFALVTADKSLGRGGSEILLYTNATPGVYYLGVKSESQQAAEYGLLAVVSDLPFAEADPLGNQLLRGIALPALIPGGTPANPGVAYVFGLCPDPSPVRRVLLTNVLTHPDLSAVRATLTHNATSVGLISHSTNTALLSQAFIYDDSGEGDIPGAQPADGPGSLRAFGGQSGYGPWQLTCLSTNQPGTNDNLWILLERQPDLAGGTTPLLLPGACRQEFLTVPPGATNLTVHLTPVTGTGPVSLRVDPAGGGATNHLTFLTTGASTAFTVDATTHPPLQSGLYVLTLCNQGPDPASAILQGVLSVDPNPPAPFRLTSVGAVAIADNTLSRSSIVVTNHDPIAAVEVGVRLNHPRLSDLALSLVGPTGTRVRLQENRGGASPEGMGLEVLATNVTPISSEGGPAASTNIFDTGEAVGTIAIDYDFYSLPDTMHIYYEGQLLFDSGLVSGSALTNLSYGPGASTSLSIIMNEGGNFDTNTAWFYTVTSTRLAPLDLTFTENTNLALTPIKFATPPLTNLTGLSADPAAENGIFYLPEESLQQFTGQPANGPWQLEIADARPGATNPAPVLLNWELRFVFNQTVPVPLTLPPGQPGTNTLGPGQIQWYAVAAPVWASFATNRLLAATAPLNLFFNPLRPPTGTNSGDVVLLSSVTSGCALLQTNTPPALLPGTTYYLGLQNLNPAPVTFTFGVDFDAAGLVSLSDGVPFAATNAGPPDYYRYVVSSNAVRAQFELQQPAADLALVLRKGLPLPSLNCFDWLSDNPGTNDELIVCYDFSSPVALTPGEWFLAVLNPAGIPAAYSILATETAAYGTNLDIISQEVTGDSVCLTWASLPGAHYFVQGSTASEGPNWVTLSPGITAPDVQTTFCLPLAATAAYPFLRIQEGLVLAPPALAIQLLPQGRLLQWTGATTNRFQVQWADSLPPVWNTFPDIITSTTPSFSFLDDGSQSGGLGSTRFYRLLVW